MWSLFIFLKTYNKVIYIIIPLEILEASKNNDKEIVLTKKGNALCGDPIKHS